MTVFSSGPALLQTCLQCPYLNYDSQHLYLKPYTSPSLSTINIVNRDKDMEGWQKIFTHFSLHSPAQPSISPSLISLTLQLSLDSGSRGMCWWQCSPSSWDRFFQRTRILLSLQPLPFVQQFTPCGECCSLGWCLVSPSLSGARGLLCWLHIWLHCPLKLHCVKIIQVHSRYSSKAFKTRLIWCKLMQLHQVNGVMLYYS